MGTDELVGLFSILDIGLGEVLQSTEVVESVVAHLMSFVENLLEEIGLFPHVVAHHEEGGVGVECPQRVEDEWRGLGYGTVVEREVYGTLVLVHAPIGFGKHPSQPEGGLFENHGAELKNEGEKSENQG